MKFHDIAIGQRFESDGATYVKTSPVLACAEGDGSSRFMPRYAVVKPLDGAERPAKITKNNPLRADDVLAAFDVFHQALTKELALAEGQIPAERLESLRATMEAGRKDFIAAIL